MPSPKVLRFGFPAPFEIDPLTGGIVMKLRPKDLKMAELFSFALKTDYTIVMATDGEFGGTLPNGSFTGPMGLLQRGEVDVVMCDIAITEQRLKYVDFSYPYFFDAFTFATKKPQFAPKFLSIVYPFTIEVWLCILACFILMSFLFYLVRREKNNLANVIFKTYGNFFNQTTVFAPLKLRDRFLILFWVIGLMIITFSYTAVLLSFLTLPIREREIRTIRELSEVVSKKEYHVGTIKGNFIPAVLSSSKDEYLKIIYEDLMNYLIDLRQVKDALLYWNEKMALIVPRNYISFLQNRIFISKDNFFQYMVGLPYQKSFCCKEKLGHVIHRVSESGLYEKLNSDFVFKSFLENLSPEERSEEVAETKLNLSDVSGAFGFLLAGYVFSILAFIIEIIYARTQKRSKH